MIKFLDISCQWLIFNALSFGMLLVEIDSVSASTLELTDIFFSCMKKIQVRAETNGRSSFKSHVLCNFSNLFN